ncbi:MAG: ZIP family metal transporter [Pirellulaceae bacterium]
MWPTFLIIAYCVLIATASLVGGYLPSLLRLTHTRMQLLMSLIGGLMLGVALLHMLPHAVVATQSLDHTATAMVIGLLAMFFLIRIFHVHGHEPHEHHSHDDTAEHEHAHACAEERMKPTRGVHGPSWVGLFVGLALHTLIDGVALAASVAAEMNESSDGSFFGMGTFLAVVLHKPLDALAITSVMIGGGWPKGWRNWVNGLFALMCPLGALAFYFGIQRFGGGQQMFVGCSLGFAAGAFLCISLADLLPEVQFHRHDRLKFSAALLLGVIVAGLIGLLEPEHAHSSSAHEGNSEHVHDHTP